jgi:hypothetical protein
MVAGHQGRQHQGGMKQPSSASGQGPPSRLRPHHDRFTPDSCRLGAPPKSAGSVQEPTSRLPLSLRQRPRHFASVLDEKPRYRAERAVL